MKEFLSEHFLSCIIGILLLVVILQNCTRSIDTKTYIGTRVDTVWREKTFQTQGNPIFIQGERDTLLERSVEYVPSADYAGLVKQFEELKRELLTRNTYSETKKFDSSTVTVTDTVQRNNLIGRSWMFNLKYPEITKTVTITPKPKTQWYIGGGLAGNQINPINQINAGLLIKNKQDGIFGVSAGIDKDGQINYGLSKYWKIKL